MKMKEVVGSKLRRENHLQYHEYEYVKSLSINRSCFVTINNDVNRSRFFMDWPEIEGSIQQWCVRCEPVSCFKTTTTHTQ